MVGGGSVADKRGKENITNQSVCRGRNLVKKIGVKKELRIYVFN